MRMEVLLAQSPAQDGHAIADGVVTLHPDPRMVAMAMRDHRGPHRPPGIDVEIARRAVHAFGTQLDDVSGVDSHGARLQSGAGYARVTHRSADSPLGWPPRVKNRSTKADRTRTLFARFHRGPSERLGR
jgi:hypothetical protein